MGEPNGTIGRGIQLSPDTVTVNGEPVILLSASLFYFRIPRGCWRERMEQVKQFGYNTIDVYFPWNYHEMEEGKWDFQGEKDAAAFLQEAAEAGLWVIARPGPYICSEWDLGGLPPYLLTKRELCLRNHNPDFLSYTAKWFEQIMPLLRSFQVDQGGTVLCVQLDNELDFYNCSDPPAYIDSLRELAQERGITVPLIACAGQGGLQEASGLVDGVVPTCNFYPDDRDPEFEDKVLHYKKILGGRGFPLLVTETNRSHYLLRRLLSCGAKLLGPYLQVSGTDFGFTNAINNWGRPLAFMTSDYDFGGMISPEGHVRKEAYEGRMLGRLLRVYGRALAQATPEPIAATEEASKDPALRRLNLEGGGSLEFLTNLSSDEAKQWNWSVTAGEKKKGIPLSLASGRSLVLPVAVPLQPWGIDGRINYSSAELFHAVSRTTGTTLFFHTEGVGELAIQLEEPVRTYGPEGVMAHLESGLLTVSFKEQRGCVHLMFEKGGELNLIFMSREDALYLETEERGVNWEIEFPSEDPLEPTPVPVTIQWSQHSMPWELPIPQKERVPCHSPPRFLEDYGIYRGFSWYTAEQSYPAGAAYAGLLIQQGSDVLSLYGDGRYIRTVVPGGGNQYIPVTDEGTPTSWTVRSEIWGHSNFDDIRLPALRLDARKGIRGIAAIWNVTDLTNNWSYKQMTVPPEPNMVELQQIDDVMRPIVSFGGWMTSHLPAREVYGRTLYTHPEADTRVLHFESLQASVQVFADGIEVGWVNPFDPYLDLSSIVDAGRQVKLALYVERHMGLPAGHVKLYEGTSATSYKVYAMGEVELAEYANELRSTQSNPVDFPLQLVAGEVAWLRGEIQGGHNRTGYRVRVEGSAMKLTVLMNNTLVGRLWTDDSPTKPEFRGGNSQSFYLPGPWFQDGACKLSILLEAVEAGQLGVLKQLTFIPI